MVFNATFNNISVISWRSGGIDNSLGNPTYTPTTLTKEEILDNHRSVLCSFGISTKDEKLDLPPLIMWKEKHLADPTI
jgi:hypothetical protein